jgi:transcriptional regulator GlxA family with amidase domain
MSRTIAFVLYPGFVTLDLAGPLDVFHAASTLREIRGGDAAYCFAFVALKLGPVVASNGLSVMADSAPADCQPHTLVVPGSVDAERAATDLALLGAVTCLAAKAKRIVSVCSGAMLLAGCGLLDGKKATTHWMASDLLARRYPNVTVEPDAIFIRDGDTFTSAGVTAGIDLALRLVEDDLGPETALDVARLLVVYRRRPGNQSQFSAPLKAQARAASRFRNLHAWMEAHLDEDLGVERLAALENMSPRHFARIFLAKTGMSPGKYVEQLRLDRARELIESGEEHMQTVAATAGFCNEERLRRTFQRRLGITPSLYLSHFSKQKRSTS